MFTGQHFLGRFLKKHPFLKLLLIPPIFPLFSNRGMLCWQWVSSRSVGGIWAGLFAALSLAYCLIEYYKEVRRTPDEPKSAAYRPKFNPQPAGCTSFRKNGQKIWGMRPSAPEKNAPGKSFVRITAPFCPSKQHQYYLLVHPILSKMFFGDLLS